MTYLNIIVELLLDLSRSGVQVFLATHDYMLAKYFEVRKNKEDHVCSIPLNAMIRVL